MYSGFFSSSNHWIIASRQYVLLAILTVLLSFSFSSSLRASSQTSTTNDLHAVSILADRYFCPSATTVASWRYDVNAYTYETANNSKVSIQKFGENTPHINTMSCTIDCPQDQNFILGINRCAYTYNADAPSLSADCAGLDVRLEYEVFYPAGSNNSIAMGEGAVNMSLETGDNQVVYSLIDDTETLLDQCTYLISISDTINPDLICIDSFEYVVNGIDECDALVTRTEMRPVAIDNCLSQIKIDLVIVDPNGVRSQFVFDSGFQAYRFALGQSLLEWTATDSSGMTASCTSRVIVRDEQAPRIQSCPQNLALVAAPSACGVNFNLASASLVQDCDISASQRYNVSSLGLSGDLPNAIYLPVGNHTIDYTINDRFGNESYCSYEVSVRDLDAPRLIGCSDDIELFVEQNSCMAGTQIRLPDNVEDDCFNSVRINDAMTKDMVFSDADAPVEPMTFEFDAELISGYTDIRVQVYVYGDVDDVDERFFIDAEGTNLGNTETSTAASCSNYTLVTQTILAADLKPILEDDVLQIQLNPTHFGPPEPEGNDPDIGAINDICNDNSGLRPRVRIELSYPDLDFLKYRVRHNSSWTNERNLAFRNPELYDFELGQSEVELVFYDKGGNRAACSYEVTVSDSFMPQLECRSIPDLEINIFDDSPVPLDPQTAVLNADDNCAIDYLELDQTSFSCYDVDRGEIELELSAYDLSGNQTTCKTNVDINYGTLDVGYNEGLCVSDTLFFRMDDRVLQSSQDFDFEWANESGQVFSTSAEFFIYPISTINEGIYTCLITNEAGCQQEVSVPVTIRTAPRAPRLFSDKSAYCEGESIMLSSDQNINGIYRWFRVENGGLVLMDSTIIPRFQVDNLTEGSYEFQLSVQDAACVSGLSNQLSIDVVESPVLDFGGVTKTVCQGQTLNLDFGISADEYDWTGPNGFLSNQAEPRVTFDAESIHGGFYKLSINQNGCWSNFDSVFVSVIPKPATPELIMDDVICEGEDLVLTASVGGADEYQWTLPNNTVLSSPINSLVIASNNVLEGAYSVTIIRGQCSSNNSAPKTLSIEAAVPLNLSSNAPLCEDESLELYSDIIPRASYQWVGPGFNSSFPNSIKDNPNPGKYILSVTSENGCSYSDSLDVLINPKPRLQGITTSIAPDVCLTGTDTLQLLPVPSQISPDLSYHWQLPNGQWIEVDTLIIFNATAAVNGEYRLYSMDQNACSSDTVSITLDYSQATMAPQIVYSAPVCEGDDLIIGSTAANGTNVIYEWETPLGIRTSLTAQLKLTNVSRSDHEGLYRVRISINGCTSAFSNAEFVEVFEKPARPLITGETMYCEGETLRLNTAFVTGYTYEWSGAGSFSNTPDFEISDIETNMSGEITLRVFNEHMCPSVSSVIRVNISSTPDAPIITSDTDLCPGEDLILSTNSISADSFIWVNPDGVEFITIDNQLIQASSDVDIGNWRVKAIRGICESVWSSPVEVRQEQAYSISISADSLLCQGEMLNLSANFIDGSSYEWLDPNNAQLGNQRILNVQRPITGFYKLFWTSPLECPIFDSVLVTVIDIPEIDSVIVSGDPCVDGTSSIQLRPLLVSAGKDLEYIWRSATVNSSDSILTIENARIGDGGTIELTIIDGQSCTSIPYVFDLELYEKPALPIVTQDQTFCEGDSIHLRCTAFSQGNIEYYWEIGTLNFTTNIAELHIDASMVTVGQSVQVQIITEFCNSEFSNPYVIDIFPSPDAPEITADEEICVGDSLKLSANFISSASYIWSGPEGFSSSLRDPAIPDALSIHAGYYKVRVEVNGCFSAFSDSVIVSVNENPSAPILLDVDAICLDQGQSTLEININSNGNPLSDRYEIYAAEDGRILSGFSTDLSRTINANDLGSGRHQVYALAQRAACQSVISNEVELAIFSIPDNFEAQVGDDLTLCTQNRLINASQFPANDTNYYGIWRQLDGPNVVRIQDPSNAQTGLIFSDLEAGGSYTFEWSISYGACLDYDSDTLSVRRVDATQLAEADNIFECNKTSVFLNAVPPTGVVKGYWTQPETQNAIIVDSTDAFTEVRNLIPGVGNQYKFTWTLTHPECPDFSSMTIDVIIDQQEACSAYAGPDRTICGLPEVRLEAAASDCSNGSWSTEGSAIILNRNETITEIRDLQVGQNLFVYTLVDIACGLLSRDTVYVEYILAAEANDDAFQVDFAGLLNLDVLDNDINFDDALIEIIVEPNAGTILEENGSLIFKADIGYIGEDAFTYRLCDTRCINYCDTAEVELVVGDELDCTVPTLITPNNDGINDIFIVPCLASSDFPDNSLTIFNQWGDQILSEAPYKNNWEGTYEGEDLPDGTYFFILNYGAKRPTESGFVLIQR